MKKGSKKISKIKQFEISDFDKGWLIGMLEGEGCFTDYFNSTTGHFCVQLLFASTDKDVVDRISKLIPVGRVGKRVYNKKSRYVSVNGTPYKTQYWWSVSDRSDFRSICVLIKDYMSERRKEKIESILANIEYYEGVVC